MRTRKSAIIVSLAIGVLSGETQAFAQSNTWTEQGPGPILNEGNTALPNMSPVAGAINAIVLSPNSADLIYVGTVNGGVWMTSNATAANPTWVSLSDTQLPQLSIKSLAMSPVDSKTLFAGTGSTSSFGRVGNPGIGVARSTDGGSTWTVLAGNVFSGRTITSIVPTTLNGGARVLAATWEQGQTSLQNKGGVYLSINNGATFTRISGNGTSGLPNSGVTSLIADPSNANRFYAGVPGVGGAANGAGVYRSDDGGMTWVKFNTGLGGAQGQGGVSTSLRILLTIHNDPANNVVYADIITARGTLGGVFRTTNQGGLWRSLRVPRPPIYAGTDKEGGQGAIHGAIAADPSNPNVVL